MTPFENQVRKYLNDNPDKHVLYRVTSIYEEENLVAEVIEETSRTVEEGYVISQEIEEGTEAFAGDTVKIHVSTGTGIKQVTVISVIGQDEATAKSNLENLGLKVNVTYQDATSDNGKVAKQSIDANKVVDEGTTITLTVNKVAETKEVTVHVNVANLVKSYFAEQSGEDEEGTTNKNVNVKVNNETRTVSNTTQNCEITLSGKEGQSLEIKVSITDPNNGGREIYGSSKTITLGAENSITF